jgi:hypothetical protein
MDECAFEWEHSDTEDALLPDDAHQMYDEEVEKGMRASKFGRFHRALVKALC